MIYDCFTYYNEIDLLLLRLNILGPHVDWFVVSESDRTFSGTKKDFLLDPNSGKLRHWAHKIRMVRTTMPDLKTAWDREVYQRNTLWHGLAYAEDDDLVFVSDVDEIWNPKILPEIEEATKQGPHKLEQRIYYYKLNLQLDMRWLGSVAFRKYDLTTPNKLREMGAEPYISDGGWHFSYLGNVDSIRDKVSAFSHTELNKAEYTNPKHIESCIENGIDIFGRDFKIKQVEIDESYPDFIVENQDELADYILDGK